MQYLSSSRSRVIRKIGQWAEDEITVPTHPLYGGRKFKVDRLPWQRHWFAELESGRWYEHCLTAPSQAGKSLSGYVIPILYNLFEVQRDVIAGVTIMEMGFDKWMRDIKPVIEETRYKELLPVKGAGSRGGFNGMVTFNNGISLKFMSAEGGDKHRAYYTSPVLIFTEVDGYTASSTSAESHPIAQIEARARSVSRKLRYVIKECTVTDADGYIWQAVTKRGTNSRLQLPCPHCGEFVLPEREDLKGWHDAEYDVDAERALFHCPACQQPWSEEQRKQANLSGRIVHGGQHIENGKMVGDPPKTKTFGLRVAAVNNLFVPAGDLGMDEWNAQRNTDEIDAEKEACQFFFCLPFEPPGLETMVKLDREEVQKRKLRYPKSVVPTNTKYITVGIDVGKFRSDWIAFAWLYPERVGLIFDYGRIEHKVRREGQLFDAKQLGFGGVFQPTMEEFLFGGRESQGIFDYWVTEDGEVMKPNLVTIDCRWQGDDPDDKVIYDALRSWKRREIMGIMGHGQNQYGGNRRYRKPSIKDRLVLKPLGHYYHIKWHPEERLHVLHADVDAWKTIFQTRLQKEPSAAGSIMMYDAINPNEHTQLAKEFDSERREPSFEKGKGRTEKWVAQQERNHKLDAGVYASIAGHRVGFRIDPRKDPKPTKTGGRPIRGLQTSRPFVITQR